MQTTMPMPIWSPWSGLLALGFPGSLGRPTGRLPLWRNFPPPRPPSSEFVPVPPAIRTQPHGRAWHLVPKYRNWFKKMPTWCQFFGGCENYIKFWNDHEPWEHQSQPIQEILLELHFSIHDLDFFFLANCFLAGFCQRTVHLGPKRRKKIRKHEKSSILRWF